MKPFWDLIQQTEARGAAPTPAEQIESLRERLDKMLLLDAAVWSLVREKLNLTDDQLTARMTEIDASDGKLDGQIVRPPYDCPQCKRKSPSRFMRCAYCS